LCCIWLLSLLPYNFYIEICCMRCFKQALNDRKVNSKRQNVFVMLLPCQFFTHSHHVPFLSLIP
jgi:hypothetical protein